MTLLNKHIAKSLVITGAMIAAGCANADVIADFNPYKIGRAHV